MNEWRVIEDLWQHRQVFSPKYLWELDPVEKPDSDLGVDVDSTAGMMNDDVDADTGFDVDR